MGDRLPERSTVDTTVASAGRKSLAASTPEGKCPPGLARRSMSNSSEEMRGSAASALAIDATVPLVVPPAVAALKEPTGRIGVWGLGLTSSMW